MKRRQRSADEKTTPHHHQQQSIRATLFTNHHGHPLNQSILDQLNEASNPPIKRLRRSPAEERKETETEMKEEKMNDEKEEQEEEKEKEMKIDDTSTATLFSPIRFECAYATISCSQQRSVNHPHVCTSCTSAIVSHLSSCPKCIQSIPVTFPPWLGQPESYLQIFNPSNSWMADLDGILLELVSHHITFKPPALDEVSVDRRAARMGGV
jgi:hypothetical protein